MGVNIAQYLESKLDKVFAAINPLYTNMVGLVSTATTASSAATSAAVTAQAAAAAAQQALSNASAMLILLENFPVDVGTFLNNDNTNTGGTATVDLDAGTF